MNIIFVWGSSANKDTLKLRLIILLPSTILLVTYFLIARTNAVKTVKATIIFVNYIKVLPADKGDIFELQPQISNSKLEFHLDETSSRANPIILKSRQQLKFDTEMVANTD